MAQPILRELVYLSETKLQNQFWPRPNRHSRVPNVIRGASAELSLGPAGVTGKLGSGQSTPAKPAGVTLDEAIEWLKQIAVDFSAPDQHPGYEWISFDLDMKVGTVHEDSGGAPDDIALFSGSRPVEGSTTNRHVCLLLCGSLNHLLRDTPSAGRAGSDSEWLVTLVRELERRENEEHSSVIPEFITRLPRVQRPLRSPAAVTLDVFSIHQQHAVEHGHFRGHARVILDFDDPKVLTDRIILATPLYVEVVHRQARTKRPRLSWRKDLE